MRSLIRSLKADTFIRQNAVSFVGSMVIAVINYAYHPVLSRMMSLEDFGEAQVLFSFSIQAGIPLGVFGMIVINLVSNGDRNEKNTRMVGTLYSLALVLMISLAMITVIASPYLKHILNFTSVLPFFALAAAFILGTDVAFLRAYLQGKGDFTALSVSGILQAAGKLAFAVVLVAFGWRTFGAVAGLTLSNLLALAYVLFKTRGALKLPRFQKIHLTSALRAEFCYGLLVFVATGFVTILYTADVILIKYFFSPEEAGLYSGIATIARIIFFVTGSISGVLLASIKLGNKKEQNFAVAKKAFLLLMLIGGPVLFILTVLPQFVTNLLIGSRFLTTVDLLPRLSLAMFFVSALNLFSMYFLALRRYVLIPISLFGVLLLLLLTICFHAAPAEIVTNFLISSGAAFILLLAVMCRDFLSREK